MRTIILILAASSFFVSCNNSSTGTTFCDTTCTSNEITFNGDDYFKQELTLKLNKCAGDSITWTHGKTFSRTQIYLPEFLKQGGEMNHIKMNKNAISCAFQDTTMIWLSFNDCKTGRGYLLKLPYEGRAKMQKITGALTDFDPKFSIDPDLRAYTDRGNLYVANVKTGKEESMTFQKEYDIDFNEIHKSVDTVNVTKQKMYIKLLDKNGNEKVFEKNIQL